MVKHTNPWTGFSSSFSDLCIDAKIAWADPGVVEVVFGDLVGWDSVKLPSETSSDQQPLPLFANPPQNCLVRPSDQHIEKHSIH